MEKSLKKYQESISKYYRNLEECKEEKRKVQEEIQAVKNGVKENAKKGKLSSLLKISDTDKLTKLLAYESIVDIQMQSITEVLTHNDNDIVRAALKYLDAVEKENDRIAEEYQRKRKEAQEKIEEGKKMAMKYSHMSQIADTSMRINQARYELSGILDKKITEQDKRSLTGASIQQLKDILTR